MYCLQCGAEIPVQARFCTQCGARVRWTSGASGVSGRPSSSAAACDAEAGAGIGDAAEGMRTIARKVPHEPDRAD